MNTIEKLLNVERERIQSIINKLDTSPSMHGMDWKESMLRYWQKRLDRLEETIQSARRG